MKDTSGKENNKIKVLQVNKLYYPVTGGIEVVVKQISEGLKEKCDIKVLVCNKKGKTINEIVNGVKVIRAANFGILMSLPISLKFFYHFYKLKDEKDIIHIHYPFPLADIAISMFGFKGKLVVSWHSDIVRQKKMMLCYKPFMKKLLKRADLIIVATEGHIKGSNYLKAYEEKCVIVPYGLSDNYINQAIKFHNTTQKPNKIYSILFVGRLVYYKGCDVLINAFSKIKTEASLTIIGDGPLKQNLIQLSKDLNIFDKVKFISNVSDENRNIYFQNCDIFVLPSVLNSEAFGLVQIEAMAFGKPVINTLLDSGVPYVSIDGETGITVKPGNPDELANAIDKLLTNQDLREKYGYNSYKKAIEHYKESVMINRIHIIYNELSKDHN